MFAEHNDLKFAVPGGLIGVGTRIDPTLCRADRLVGHVLGLRGNLPDIYVELEINYYLLRRLLGVKTADGKQAKVQKLAKAEVLMVNIGSSATGAKVSAVKADAAMYVSFSRRTCVEILFTKHAQPYPHFAGMHTSRREDRVVPKNREALAVDWLGNDSPVSPLWYLTSLLNLTNGFSRRGKTVTPEED